MLGLMSLFAEWNQQMQDVVCHLGDGAVTRGTCASIQKLPSLTLDLPSYSPMNMRVGLFGFTPASFIAVICGWTACFCARPRVADSRFPLKLALIYALCSALMWGWATSVAFLGILPGLAMSFIMTYEFVALTYHGYFQELGLAAVSLLNIALDAEVVLLTIAAAYWAAKKAYSCFAR